MAESKTQSSVPRADTLLDAIKYLETFETREQRSEILKDHRKSLLPQENVERYEQLRTNEYHHIKHVRATFTELFPDAPPCQHDYTKDEFYIFMTVLAFNFNLKEQLPQELWQSELDRHCGTEPHHPEFESLHMDKGPRITDMDVAETVCDRLSRNLQFGGGEYDDDKIRSFEPKFSFDHERRIELYRKYVQEFKPTVKKVWDNMKQKL